jgi:hypothetical protein
MIQPASVMRLGLVSVLGAVGYCGASTTTLDWLPKAPALPAPKGQIIRVQTTEQLVRSVELLQNGQTLLVADGEYRLPRVLVLAGKTNVVIRGASGDPANVVLCGKGWDAEGSGDDILHIGPCKDIVVADLTFADCRSYGIKVEAEHGPTGIHIHNCRFRNIGVRAIKGSAGSDPALRAVKGSVRYCSFENTKIPPPHWLFGGDYISAIDMMALEDWTFSYNLFREIRGRNGGGRAAIFLWVRSRNVVVEGNVIINCDRGIAFGNPGQSTANVGDGPPVYVSGGSIRNNFISGGADCGIELWHVRGIKVFHNSIWRPDQHWNRGIRVGAGVAETEIANNLVHGGIVNEGGEARVHHNLSGEYENYFAAPGSGNLELTEHAVQAVNGGAPLPDVPLDIRGKRRDDRPDLGAWEYDGSSARQ